MSMLSDLRVWHWVLVNRDMGYEDVVDEYWTSKDEKGIKEKTLIWKVEALGGRLWFTVHGDRRDDSASADLRWQRERCCVRDGVWPYPALSRTTILLPLHPPFSSCKLSRVCFCKHILTHISMHFPILETLLVAFRFWAPKYLIAMLWSIPICHNRSRAASYDSFTWLDSVAMALKRINKVLLLSCARCLRSPDMAAPLVVLGWR